MSFPNGTVLRSFAAPDPGNYTNGRAVAFDGTNLWITYDGTRNPNYTYVYKVSTTGTLLQTLNVGVSLGALAWDPTRKVLWGGAYPGGGGSAGIYTVDPSTGTTTRQFGFTPQGGNCPHDVPGAIDGLSYDPSTDTLWISDDEGNVVFNVSTTGSIQSSFPVSKLSYGCNSGIAVQTYSTGGPSLWAFDVNSRVAVHSDLTGNLLGDSFFTNNDQLEGIAFDASTFAPNCALWSNEASSGTPSITAYQVPCTASASLPPAPQVEFVPEDADQNPPSPIHAHAGFGVDTKSGNFTYTHTDFVIPGRGPSPAFTRTYNSDDTRIGPFSDGWTHSYDIRLRSGGVGAGPVLIGPQGRRDAYTLNPDGTYAPPPAVYTTLVHNADNTWTATLKDQTTWTFDPVGNLTRITDPHGNFSSLTYNGYGQLASVQDSAERGSLSFNYAPSGALTSVGDWSTPSRVVYFNYDFANQLSAIHDRDNQTTNYGYVVFNGSETDYLGTITDANGNKLLTNGYDSYYTLPPRGRIIAQQDGLGLSTGQKVAFSYTNNSDGTQTTVVTYPTTSFDSGWNPTIIDTYDGTGSSGRIVTRSIQPTSSHKGPATIEDVTYDANSDVATLTDGNGNVTSFCYDLDYTGAVIAGSHGNLTRVIRPGPSTGANQPVTLYQYDAKNNLTEWVNPQGVATGTSVSCSTNLTAGLNSNYATDLLYDSTGDLLSITHRYTDPATGPQTAVTKFVYGDSLNPGMVTEIIPPRGNLTPSPDLSYATTFTYGTGSQAGMLVKVVDPLGDATTFAYDSVGRLLSMVDPNGNVSGANPADHTWSYSYDNEDRLLTFQEPAPISGGTSLVQQFQYDAAGNRTVAIDANGQVTKYSYDARESLSEVDQSPNPWTDPAAAPSPLYQTTYQYDNLGNLTQVTRANNDTTYQRATAYTYDGLNRLMNEVQYPSWPSTNKPLVTQYTYDADSNLLTLVEPLGSTTTNGYDALNRLTSITYSDRKTPNVSYRYDANGNRTTMVDGTGTTSYVYDELNRLTSVTSPGNKTVGYRYDLDGNRTQVTYADNTAVTYTFNKASQLSSLLDWANRTTSYQYLADGSLQAVTNVDGSTGTYSYDNAQRLVQVLNQSGSTTLGQHSYNLDKVGNRTALSETLAQLSGGPLTNNVTYGYDQLYRLTSVNNGATAYGYDPVGNRLTKNGTSYTYDRADRILTAGSTSYTVNANGNVTARGSDTFAYDQANRMTSATVSGTTSSDTYDGDSKRASKTVGSTTTSYVYDVNGALPNVLSDGTFKYVYGLGLTYAVDGSGNVQVYHTDGLGSVRAITDANGNLIQTYQTDEFGIPTQTQGSSTQPFQYTGQQVDGSGLIYLRARLYDPTAGRFLSRDPLHGAITSPQTLNPYAYAGNNPATLTDPNGYCGELPPPVGVVECVGEELAESPALEEAAPAVEEEVTATSQTLAPQVLAWIQKGPNKAYDVYVSVSERGVRYVGITTDFLSRRAQHLRMKGIGVVKIQELSGLPRADA